MEYTVDEIRQFTAEEDVKFLRLAFCDIFGSQKNISILPDELDRAFSYGIAFDASAVPGFGDEVHSDLFLHPDSSTLCMLPWRPDHGRVARMFCHVLRPAAASGGGGRGSTGHPFLLRHGDGVLSLPPGRKR